MKAREHAVGILEEFDRHTSSVETILSHWMSENEIDKRDRRLVHELVYGVMRNRLAIDHVLEQFLTDRRFFENEALMRILRVGAYQIIYLDRIPVRAAVNEAVEMCKNDRQIRSMSGVVNAVLRRVDGVKEKLPFPGPNEPLLKRLSVKYSHPEPLIARWLEQFGELRTKKLLEFNNTTPAITLRRTIRGNSRQNFENEMRELCDIKSGGRGFQNLYYTLVGRVMPSDIPLFASGGCTVQAESSGWAVALLDIKQGNKVLDICSAPGGKSTLAAELIGEGGIVCAGELREGRLRKVVESAERMNLDTVLPVVLDGRDMPFDFMFDRILLDAPCSGTGVMNHHPDARWHREEADIGRAAVLQDALLESAAKYVKVGGALVYSTCSIDKEENIDRVEKFLSVYTNFELDDASQYVPGNLVDRKGCLSITPFDHGLDGMFAARLKRIS